MRCPECKWKYPDSYLNQMFMGGKGYTRPICGICALEMQNQFLGVTRTHFSGEIAETMRLSAIEWRRTHPNDGPITSGGPTQK